MLSLLLKFYSHNNLIYTIINYHIKSCTCLIIIIILKIINYVKSHTHLIIIKKIILILNISTYHVKFGTYLIIKFLI